MPQKIIVTLIYYVIRDFQGTKTLNFDAMRHILSSIVREKMSALMILIDSTNRNTNVSSN